MAKRIQVTKITAAEDFTAVPFIDSIPIEYKKGEKLSLADDHIEESGDKVIINITGLGECVIDKKNLVINLDHLSVL